MPFVLYETLGPTLPDGAAAAAALWGLAHRCAMTLPRRRPARRPRRPTARRCSTRSSTRRSGIVFTVDDYEDAWSYVDHARPAGSRSTIPELLDELRAARGPSRPAGTSDEFPFVLSAGERRSSTANTIFRDPDWRKRDGTGRCA